MATSNALVFKGLSAAGSNTDAATYATSSVSPTSGRVQFLVVVSQKATTPDTPTASGTNGFSGTWAQIGSTVTVQTAAGDFIGLSVFWSVAASGTAGVVTAAFGGNNQKSCCLFLCESPFVNVTTPAVQSKSATDTSSSTLLPSITLDSALASNQNWVLVALAQQTGAAPSAAAQAYQATGTAVGSSTSASDGSGLRVLVVPANSLTPPSGTWTASVGKAILAIEIAQDGTGVSTGGGIVGGRMGLGR